MSGREPTPKPARTTGAGFAARLQGASLFDLVQFECLQRSRRIVRVSSRGVIGYVFFRDGDVVHAATGRHVGESALREMLGWQDGVVETWSGVWPERETITVPWQRLLLEAAQASDEATAPKVISFPAREGVGIKSAEPITSAVPAPEPAPRQLESVTLSPDGSVIRGHASSDLPEAAAYAVELAALIGEFLGLDDLRAVEASFDHAHFMVARTSEGNVVAARAAQPGDLEPLKKELGL